MPIKSCHFQPNKDHYAGFQAMQKYQNKKLYFLYKNFHAHEISEDLQMTNLKYLQ